MPSKTEIGRLGEEEAKKYLIQKGYRYIRSNYKAIDGEIDLIFEWGSKEIVFVEVKTCSYVEAYYSMPEEAVNKLKQSKLIATANIFLEKTRRANCDFRFDIVTVHIDYLGYIRDICHFENALED